jgi:hypothetical protein
MNNLELIEDTFNTCKEYLPRLISAVGSIPGALQSNKENEAFDLLPGIFQGLEWVIKIFTEIKKLQYKIDINPTELNEFFAALEEALKIKDYVLVSDIFEYEILPVLERWKKTVEKL